jgi:hypothetical protein
MIRIASLLLGVILCILVASFVTADKGPSPLSLYVNEKGIITLPDGFRQKWTHLGTWIVTSQTATGPKTSEKAPGIGVHEVYTQPESVKSHNRDGKWPDGTVLVMEIRNIQWDDMPTGHVMCSGDVTGWFVMVKDSENRFKGNPNWGDGWGWAAFKPSDPQKNISANYKEDCADCHRAARTTDWIFIVGYRTLRD